MYKRQVFELLVILTDFHGVDELNEGGEVLLLHRSLIVDIANKRAVQQRFCFYPKIVSGLAFAFCITASLGVLFYLVMGFMILDPIRQRIAKRIKESNTHHL